MNTQTICILFSILLVPVNLLCTHWMTQEAVHLTGMTYMEFKEATSGISASSVRRKRNWWYYVHFFNEYSANPEKSICFMRMHVAAVLPSVAAMYLLARVYASPDRVSFGMTGNCILLAVNLVLAAGGALYRRGHPLDPVAAEKLREKHQAERAYSRAHLGKTAARAAVPVGVLLAVLYIFGSGAASGRTETPDPVHFAQILQEKGYETADVSLTYGRIDRNKLTQAIAGAKGGSRVECYRYADDKTVDLVYNQISYETAPDLEPRARESHETALSGGGKMFTIVADGVYYLVLFRGDTLIYACSPDSLTEINEILAETGYLRR